MRGIHQRNIYNSLIKTGNGKDEVLLNAVNTNITSIRTLSLHFNYICIDASYKQQHCFPSQTYQSLSPTRFSAKMSSKAPQLHQDPFPAASHVCSERRVKTSTC